MTFAALTFGDAPVAALAYQSHAYVLARQVGRALGFGDDGEELVRIVLGERDAEWQSWLIYGYDYVVVQGLDLRCLNARLRAADVPTDGCRDPRRLVLLTEPGVIVVAYKCGNPDGPLLRRRLAREVFPQVETAQAANQLRDRDCGLLELFIAERCRRGSEALLPAFYAAHELWSFQRGFPPLAPIEFFAAIARLGFELRTDDRGTHIPVGLREDNPDVPRPADETPTWS